MFRLEMVFYIKENGVQTHIVVDTETDDLFTTMSTMMNAHYPAEIDAINVSRILDEDENDQDDDSTHSH